tara:strand:- start:331971 stop:332483 length:513 start_codon:yes stop_codon:yes gene_type:complete
MEIILVGYMGSGKSTLAKQIAGQLQLKMIDLDDYIADKENDTINSIFKNKGEIYFRKIESQALDEIITNQKNYVLAVGGGTPCYANNSNLIKNVPHSFYLKGSIQTLYDRLVHKKHKRPLIKNLDDSKLLEFIAKHLFERNPYYEKVTHTIQIDSKSVEAVVAEIILNTQ